jgi:glycosyltransferase involved in cell wall biosynthesis
MAPKVSVVLPVYNGEAWLDACIRSVLKQSETGFELLIGDDRSFDKSREIIGSFESDSRVRTFFFERNAGLFGNLNRLLDNARSPLVRFLCQDDILEPNCLADDVAYFENRPDVVMSICSVSIIDINNKVVNKWDASPIVVTKDVCLQLLLYHGCIAGNLSTVTARLAAINRVGQFDRSFRLAGDYEMWVRLCQVGHVAGRHERLVNLREHEARLSKAPGGGPLFIDENRRIRAKILQLLPDVIQHRATRYTYWRQNVLDAHHFVRCLIAGRAAECSALIKIIGFRDLAAGLLLWAITVNNHLYRPRPIFES